MRRSGILGRLVVLALFALSWTTAARTASGAGGRGLTLLVSPPSIPPQQASTITVRVLDSAARVVVGATIHIGGANVAGTIPPSGVAPMQLKVTPAGSGPVVITASRQDFATITAQVPVVQPRVPALVAALNPELGILAEGVSVVRDARLNDPLFFRWRARTNATQRGSLRFADGSVMDMDTNTEVLIKNPARTFLQTGRVFLQVLAGGQSHDVETGGGAVAASEGTRYQVQVSNGQTTVTVYSGRLSLRNAGQTVSVWTGYQSSFAASAAPSAAAPVKLAAAPAWTAGLPVAQGAGAPTFAYLLRGGHRLDIFSIDSRQVVRTVPLPATVRGLGLGRDEQDVFVATESGVVDVPLPNGAPRTLISGIRVSAVATLPSHQIALADATDGAVQVVDTGTGQIIHTIALGYTPAGLAASQDGTLAVVSGGGEASLLDLTNGRVMASVDAPGGAGQPSVSADGQLAFVPVAVRGTVLELSPAARGIVGQIRVVNGGPVGELNASVAYGDGRVFVADAQGGTVDVLDPVGETVLARYPIGATPFRLAQAPDGKLAVTTRGPSDLVLLDPLDGAILDRIPLSDPDLNPPLALSRHGMVTGPAAQPMGAPVYAEGIWSSVPASESAPAQPGQPQYQPSATPAVTSTATSTSTVTATPTLTPIPPRINPGKPIMPPPSPVTTEQPTPQPTRQPTQPPPPTPTQCTSPRCSTQPS